MTRYVGCGRLNEHLNEIDPHYRYELATGAEALNTWPSGVAFSVGLGDVRVDAFAKYRGAVKDRPISISALVAVGSGIPKRSWRLLGYGLEATIPHRMVSNVTIDRAIWFWWNLW